MNEQDYLQHYGVLGMKWGRRKSRQDSGSSSGIGAKHRAKQETLKSYRQDKGPKRFKVMNAANSAARSYYRKDRASNLKTYKKHDRKMEQKQARLTDDQIKAGRYRVARARTIKRNVAATAVSVALASAAVASGGAAAAPVIAAASAVPAHFITGAHYYGRQRRAYGGTRAKYQNQVKR